MPQSKNGHFISTFYNWHASVCRNFIIPENITFPNKFNPVEKYVQSYQQTTDAVILPCGQYAVEAGESNVVKTGCTKT